MKRFKKLIMCVMSVVMLLTCTLGLTGCGEDIKKLELTFEVYNYEAGVTETHTMHVDLYRHLATQTVDTIIGYVNDGYYDDLLVYKLGGTAGTNQLMLGDIKYDPTNDLAKENYGFYLNDIKPMIPGEFASGGTVGSNLKNTTGSIGLWRSWYASDETYTVSSSATGSGRATWYIPTDTISDYNGNFCVFAQFDLENEDNEACMDALSLAFSSDEKYVNYVVYYTGEYDETKVNQNFGLEFHVMLQEDYLEVKDTLDQFVAEDYELMQYNATTIRVPFVHNEIGARLVSAKMV